MSSISTHCLRVECQCFRRQYALQNLVCDSSVLNARLHHLHTLPYHRSCVSISSASFMALLYTFVSQHVNTFLSTLILCGFSGGRGMKMHARQGYAGAWGRAGAWVHGGLPAIARTRGEALWVRRLGARRINWLIGTRNGENHQCLQGFGE